MARNLLTALEIRSSDKSKLRDGDGLWLHANKSGARSWVFIYVRNGRRREMGLGPYGSGTGQVSLADARTKAEEIRGILGRGGDPFADMSGRKAKVRPATFRTVANEYIDSMRSKWRGAKTEAGWRRMVDTYAKSIGGFPVAEIDTETILRVLRPLWHEMPETADRVRLRVKMILDHARARGLRSGDNPAEWKGHLDQILPPAEKLRTGHRAAMAYADVPGLVAKLRAAKGVGARALEFTILTAARSGETRGATWSELDLDAKVWTIPAGRMKEQREHRVPLTGRAIEILRAVPRHRGTDVVFLGASLKRPLSDMTLLKALRTAGVEGATVHGFRSSFRDWAAEETSHPREIAEAALSHAVGDRVERAYRRGDALEKRRGLMEDWANYLRG